MTTNGYRTARALGALALLAPAAACHGGEERPRQHAEYHGADFTIDVEDRREETAERSGVERYVIEPLITPKEPARIIYAPPPDLALVGRADSIVGSGSETGGDSLARPSGKAPEPTSGPERKPVKSGRTP